MVIRVAERAQRSGAGEVIVATDHPEIFDAVRAAGYDVIMTRKTHASGTDRLAEVARRRRFGARRAIVNVQGDEPFIDPALIRNVAQRLEIHRRAAIATAAHPLANADDLANPNVVKVVLDREGRALYFSRAPIPYARDAFAGGIRGIPQGLPVYRHLGIYAYRASFLDAYTRLKPAPIERHEALEQLRALYHGYAISVAVTRRAPPPGIDTPEDLQRALSTLAKGGARSSARRKPI